MEAEGYKAVLIWAGDGGNLDKVAGSRVEEK